MLHKAIWRYSSHLEGLQLRENEDERIDRPSGGKRFKETSMEEYHLLVAFLFWTYFVVRTRFRKASHYEASSSAELRDPL